MATAGVVYDPAEAGLKLPTGGVSVSDPGLKPRIGSNQFCSSGLLELGALLVTSSTSWLPL